MEFLKVVRSMAAELGWPVAMMFVCHRVLETVSGSRARLLPYVFVAQPFGQETAALRPDAAVWVGRLLAGDELVAQIPRAPEVLSARWDAGNLCYAASVGGVLAGQIWLQRGTVDDDEVRCRYRLPAATAVWDFDLWVAPRFRLGRTMARLWRHVDVAMLTEGVQWSFSRISMYNSGSIKSHARLGATPTRRAVFLLLGPLQVMWSDGRPRLAVSWGLRGRPTLDLTPPR